MRRRNMREGREEVEKEEKDEQWSEKEEGHSLPNLILEDQQGKEAVLALSFGDEPLSLPARRLPEDEPFLKDSCATVKASEIQDDGREQTRIPMDKQLEMSKSKSPLS